MKTIGLIGGTSWISTIEYYRIINQLTNERLGGLNSANTRKLAELCKKYNSQTFHLQNWNELDKSNNLVL